MGNPEHECRNGRRCKSRTRDDEGEWHGAGVEDAGKLCQPCEGSAFDAIRALGHDYLALQDAILEPRGRIDGPKVMGSSERKIPIPLDVDTLMSEIDDEALRWTVRITRGDALPGTPHERVSRCVSILSANLGTLIDLPAQTVTAWFPHPDGGDWDGRLVLDGVDAVLRLAKLHHRAQSVLGLVETTTWLAESCHVCGLRTLTIASDGDQPDDSLVSCRSCKNVWSQAQFARLNNPLVAS